MMEYLINSRGNTHYCRDTCFRNYRSDENCYRGFSNPFKKYSVSSYLKSSSAVEYSTLTYKGVINTPNRGEY